MFYLFASLSFIHIKTLTNRTLFIPFASSRMFTWTFVPPNDFLIGKLFWPTILQMYHIPVTFIKQIFASYENQIRVCHTLSKAELCFTI